MCHLSLVLMFTPLWFLGIYSAARTRLGVKILTSVPSIPLGSILQGMKKHPNSLLSKNQASMHRAAHDNVSCIIYRCASSSGRGGERETGVLGIRTLLLPLVFSCACCWGRQSWGLRLPWMVLEAVGLVVCGGCRGLWESGQWEEEKNEGRWSGGIWGQL